MSDLLDDLTVCSAGAESPEFEETDARLEDYFATVDYNYGNGLTTIMATASWGHEPGGRECSICHELLMVPKLLICGHHLCRHCLISWIQTKGKEAACPLCRSPILQSRVEEEKGGVVAVAVEEKKEKEEEEEEEESAEKGAEAIADGFPTDLFMEELVEGECMLIQDPNCRVCEDVAATALCLQCGDPLCSSCKKAHRKLTVSKNHMVADLASLTPEKLAATRLPVCQTHPDEMCQLYCDSHAVAVCWLCASTKHRACSDLKELDHNPDEEDEEGRRPMDVLVEQLTAGESEMERAIVFLDEHWEKTDQYTSTAIAEIEETRQRLCSSIDAWEEGMKKKVWEEHAYIKAAVQEAKENLLRRRGQLSTHKAITLQGQDMKNREVVNKMVTVMKTRVQELDCTDVLPVDAKVISALEVTLNTDAMSRVERKLSGLGRVFVSPAEVTGILKPTKLRFHDNHSEHIELSNSQETAKKIGFHYDGGIIVACDPMKQGFLYEIKIDNHYSTVGKRRLKLESVSVGAVTEPPHTIVLPDNAICMESAFVRGRHFRLPLQNQDDSEFPAGPSTIADVLSKLMPDDRVGVSLGFDNSLHIYVNGAEFDRFTAVPQPCYALFELCGKSGQVTAMPVTKLPVQ